MDNEERQRVIGRCQIAMSYLRLILNTPHNSTEMLEIKRKAKNWLERIDAENIV